eukprot:CAMPEP_0175132080 /NCGR_PEP_ID=MMETSP0087-20121206/6887_1 /TAXON_ID=136419 /ORGANISM="Unknown Unknown, Strain D1" /LENGTH=221 /DNA_ID=CAMNT_0016414417 /DNA_START=26 /DNA_END=688 /DNA_ORIENTATION=+
MAEIKQVDWAKIAAKLPWGKDKESSSKRKVLFRQFDPNGNGLLSLAETDKGILELQLQDVVTKPVLMRAFQAAKGINQSGTGNDDYVEYGEFRMLLLYIRQYVELYVMFEAIDANKDRRIEAGEFANAVGLIDKWGFKVEDPDAVFKEIDADGGGVVLFDEFAHWAIQKRLDLEDDDDAEDAGAGSGLITLPVKKGASTTTAEGKPVPMKMQVDWAAVAAK